MTGKQKIEAALSSEGTREIPAVICYEELVYRDHWKQITDCPWWYNFEYDINRQILWQRDAIERVGQDWFLIRSFGSREDRQNLFIEARSEGVFRVDKRTGKEEKLVEPEIGGGNEYIESILSGESVETTEDIDRLIPSVHDINKARESGCYDMSLALTNKFDSLYPVYRAATPLNYCFFLLGFEETMIKIATQPELIEYTCKRYLDIFVNEVREGTLMGASGIFIQDCYSDMINPDDFKILNVRYTSQLVEEIRSLGLKSIYYFTGNSAGKLDQILSMGADAYSFEESKKNFKIDIEDLVDEVQGRYTLLGNLDSIEVLQNGTEEQLKAEISKQISAGRKNRNRFVMSLGSPVTPLTPVERVRLYCDLVHELGKG